MELGEAVVAETALERHLGVCGREEVRYAARRPWLERLAAERGTTVNNRSDCSSGSCASTRPSTAGCS